MKKILFLLLAINLYSEEIYASFDVLGEKSAKLALPAVGVVNKIYKEIGNYVKKGDVLLELDYSIESVGLQNAKAQYELSKIALSHAQNTLNRYKQVKSVINAQSLDEVEFKKDEVEQRLKSAKTNILKYSTLINQKKLKAPFSGVISAKLIEVGEGVAGVQQPVFVLDSYPNVKLLLSFDEKYAKNVKVGDNFEYIIDGLKMTGIISKIYPNIDIKTRKIYAEVKAKNLKIGSYGEGYIKTGE